MEQQEKLLVERDQQLAEGQAGLQASATQSAELEQRCLALAGQVEELERQQQEVEERRQEQQAAAALEAAKQQETVSGLETAVAELKSALAEKHRQLLR